MVSKTKSKKINYKDLGIVADPNRSIGIKIKTNKKKKEKVTEFVRKLEEEASRPTVKKFKFGKVMCQELEYYIQKYGDDYQSMARDKKNIYQDSPGQLRAKIIKYNKIHKNQ